MGLESTQGRRPGQESGGEPRQEWGSDQDPRRGRTGVKISTGNPSFDFHCWFIFLFGLAT